MILKWALGLVAVASVWTGAQADETPLSKSCIFAVAAQLPAVPGLVIKSSATSQGSVVPVGSSDPTLRQWNVTLTVEAAGQVAAYEAQCSVGNKTPPSVAALVVRDPPPPPPAITARSPAPPQPPQTQPPQAQPPQAQPPQAQPPQTQPSQAHRSQAQPLLQPAVKK